MKLLKTAATIAILGMVLMAPSATATDVGGDPGSGSGCTQIPPTVNDLQCWANAIIDLVQALIAGALGQVEAQIHNVFVILCHLVCQ
jgi:hypothetical protein